MTLELLERWIDAYHSLIRNHRDDPSSRDRVSVHRRDVGELWSVYASTKNFMGGSMISGSYVLNLSCSNPHCESTFPKGEYYGSSRANCMDQARGEGWIVGEVRQQCPDCASKKEVDTGKGGSTPWVAARVRRVDGMGFVIVELCGVFSSETLAAANCPDLEYVVFPVTMDRVLGGLIPNGWYSPRTQDGGVDDPG